MIIIGHEYLDNEDVYSIENIDDINDTSSNSIVVFEFCKKNIELLKYCKSNDVRSAVFIKSIEDLVLSNVLGADFIFCTNKDEVLQYQKIVDSYMMDLKLLLVIEQQSDIKYSATNELDGVIFKNHIKGL